MQGLYVLLVFFIIKKPYLKWVSCLICQIAIFLLTQLYQTWSQFWPWALWYNKDSCFSWHLTDQTSEIPCQNYPGWALHNNLCTKHTRMFILYFHPFYSEKEQKKKINPRPWRKYIFLDLEMYIRRSRAFRLAAAVS